MANRVIVVGASGDGISAIGALLHDLRADFDTPLLAVQHVGKESLGYLPSILSRASKRPVVHPKQGEVLRRGVIYVAPPDQHILLRGSTIRLSRGPHESYHRPSIDVLFRSAAISFGGAAIGVVLTGYLSDGTAGIAAIHDRGGTAIVQNPATAGVPEMPRSVMKRVHVDHVCDLHAIAPLLVTLAQQPIQPDGEVPAWMEAEDRIAGGDPLPHDLENLLVDAVPSRRTCPLCRTSLFQLRGEVRFQHFRCRGGHAFTDVTLGGTADGMKREEVSP